MRTSPQLPATFISKIHQIHKLYVQFDSIFRDKVLVLTPSSDDRNNNPNHPTSTLIENLEGRAHGGLDVQDLDVLPVLLQQRHQEVDSELHIEGDVARGHGDVGNGQGKAHNLLHLELDGGLNDINLLLDVLVIITTKYWRNEKCFI